MAEGKDAARAAHHHDHVHAAHAHGAPMSTPKGRKDVGLMSKLAIFGGEPVRNAPFARWPVFDDRERAALNEVLESGLWGGYSPKVHDFEQAFAEFHQTTCGVTAANGTVTLETALAAAGIKAGDEVIVPPISFIATATAVLRLGALPVFADIHEDTCNLDPERIVEAITPRTRAIIPVHFAGQPADMDAITEIAQRHDLILIEDCAHAHGATWRGQKVGSFGDFGSFSFQASKNMTAGEGGILITSDEALAEQARSICNQGRKTGGGWYEHVRLGTNFRLTGWQAALLLVQLARLPEQLERRDANAKFITEQLRQSDMITTLVTDERVTRHAHYLFMLRLNLSENPGVTKERFVAALNAEGIPCAAGYPHPLYRNQVFESYAHHRAPCPSAEQMCLDTFWISHEILLAEQRDLEDFTSALMKVRSEIHELERV